MHLALPSQKTLLQQIAPAGWAAAIIAFGAFVIPVHYPLEITNGRVEPAVVSPGETVEISWHQDWKQLCPLSVVREFVGADGFKATAARLDVEPPAEKGAKYGHSDLTIPNLPAGSAFYSATISPKCWLDRFIWQRSYKTPEIAMMVLPKTPPGPH